FDTTAALAETGDDTTTGGDGTTGGGDTTGGDDGTSGGHDGGHDGGHIGGHDDPHDNSAAIDPPGVGASSAEINAYLDALAALPDTHSHGNDAAKAEEHMAALGLVERGEATHVAIGDGDWDDPSIWSNGQVPGDGAKVLVPQGVTVNYGVVSDARLFTVRVDGKLDFATDTDSQMIFDTMVVAPSGYLEIGTMADPVDPNVTIDLIVANNGPIDTNWDPMLLSRGIVSHGKTSIHGAEKDSHDKVTEDPMAGDTSVKFAAVPTGWQVGDTIVIAGTHYDGWSGNRENWSPPEDEVRVITKIDDDGRIHFDEALIHDHDAPREDLKTSVANYTRNVSVETENAETAEVFERGHVMFMHNDDVDVRYAEFHELGRTDKSIDALPVDDFDTIRFDSNVQGRYSLHLHRAGVEDINDPAILEGNAVFGSPGWGYVHHDSNAILDNNASYDTFGAGFVAETGNETGAWNDNIAIFAQGISWSVPKNQSEIVDFFDTAKGGDGFWFQGRMVSSTDNIAASVNHGFVYFHRDQTGTMERFDSDLFAFPDAMHYRESVTADDAPIRIFEGNETFAANEGLHVVKANTSQGHDVWSHLTDFTAWNVETGAHLQYTSHYILEDFDVVGKEPSGWSDADYGLLFGNNLSDIVVKDSTIEGFDVGINLNKEFTNGTPEDRHDYFVIDTVISDVNRDYTNYDPSRDTIMSSGEAAGLDPNLELGRLSWTDGGDRITLLEGTKEDSLGRIDFPNGMDIFRLRQDDIIRYMEQDGYYTTSGGDAYILIDIYFTDRLTGELFKEVHPIWLEDVGWGASKFDNVVDNGQQNIVTQNGVAMAGDTVLDTAIPVSEPATVLENAMVHQETMAMMPEAETLEAHMAMESMSTTIDEIWMDGYAGTETLGIAVGDDALFVNTGDIENVDLLATGGDTVLASDGSYTVGADRTLAVFEASARVGFDGEDGTMSLLEFEEDANLLYAAQDGDLGTIEEFDSGQFGGDTQSGIDLGSAKLSIDLTGLSAEAANTFTLLSADELVGVFKEALVEGLGPRDAKVMVDYASDSVTLELIEGTGAVEIVTSGDETEVSDGYEALWETLTSGHAMPTEMDPSLMDEDEHLLHDAA
ncbi:MAG: G8 domain-containing protein, partial [Rhodobacter sp.]|nr:G8 domain-containing protein [Rhodobacter sp.]